LANYLGSDSGTGGWKGTKIKAHLDLNYLAARLASSTADAPVKKGILRPFGGVEIWRGQSQIPQTRVIAEFGWLAHFKPSEQATSGPGKIEDIWLATGGIRFFLHRYAALDVGVRYQSNYDGLSESTLQTQLRLGLPTHLIRSRIIGI
jgi:hypothetical protein